MAEIHGRVTGQAGVCSSTPGPGAINLLLGTADAETPTPPRWSRSRPRSASTASTRSRTRASTSSPCSLRLPSGPTPCSPPGTPSPRWCARPSRWPARPSGRAWCTWPCPRTSRTPAGAGRPRPLAGQHAAARRALALTDRPRPSPSWRRLSPSHRAGRPRRGTPQRRVDRPVALRRDSWACRSPPPSSAKACSPTTIPTRWAPWASWRHDDADFGFDEADLIISVGYDLSEFDPVRINPNWDHADHPPEPGAGRSGRATYDVDVGVQADIGRHPRRVGRRRVPPLRKLGEADVGIRSPLWPPSWPWCGGRPLPTVPPAHGG